MIGFFVGAVCLVALMKMVRRGRRMGCGGGGWGGRGYARFGGAGCHDHGYGGHGHSGHGYGGYRHGGPDFHGFGGPPFGHHGYGHPFRGYGPSGFAQEGGAQGWHGEGAYGDDGSSGFGLFGGWRKKSLLFAQWRKIQHLFWQVGATPEQQKTIQNAAQELFGVLRSKKDEMKIARKEFADAMRGESFDENVLGSATYRLEATIDTARKAMIDAFAKIHAVLDPKQRGMVADWIAGNQSWFQHPFGGPAQGRPEGQNGQGPF